MSVTGDLVAEIEDDNIDEVKNILKNEKLLINKLINKETALSIACAKGNLEAVKLLLEHPKIDINKGKLSSSGWGSSFQERYTSPLFGACESESLDIVKLLLSRKDIDVNKGYGIKIADKDDKKTPLHVACEKNNKKIVLNLLCHPKIKFDTKYYGKTPEAAAELDIKNLFYEIKLSKGKFRRKYAEEC